MRNTNIYSVRDAIQHITRAIQLNKDSNSQQLPYFFIAGAGISAPNIPSANGIIEKCKEQVKSMCSSDEYQHHVDTIGMENVADQYSSWMALAFPNKIDRSNFFRQQIKNAGITSANLLLAQILCSKKVATTVLTPNFDDILKQSMDLLGQRNVLVAENSMDNLSITPYNQEELQIVHVHGTYRFYDCANLNSEILEVTNKNGTLSSTQLLRNFLQAQAPIIIGYSGWESDVIMTCLAERLSYPVPRSYIWVCYTQEDYAKLPEWLKSNKDVIFVLPDSYFIDEKCDTNVETKRKDPSFGDEYVKQQYCQTVDAASFFYSFAGAVFSFCGMVLLKKTGKFSHVAVSVAGGVLHNAGQILMACILLGTNIIAYYLPILILSGTLAGIVIGLLASVMVSRIRLELQPEEKGKS